MSRHTYRNDPKNWMDRCVAYILSLFFLLKIRRFLRRISPFFKLQSRVKNIVYLSWLVDIERVRFRYPQHVQLWQKQGKTIFTILTYQHEHFGFSLLGPLRKLMPSPKQSNWRFYIHPQQQEKTVIFEQVFIDQKLYAFSGRLASDTMPAQYVHPFQHHIDQQFITTELKSDSVYQLQSSIQLKAKKHLPTAWQNLFNSWDEAIGYLVDQDHAWVEWVDCPKNLSQGDIKMPFNFTQIQPAYVSQIDCPLLQQWGVNPQDAFAFVVPELDFYVLGENPIQLDS